MSGGIASERKEVRKAVIVGRGKSVAKQRKVLPGF